MADTTIETAAPAVQRVRSLDAFRGLVILTMVLVNFLAGVSQLPAWAKHAPGTVDGYTIVDLVFPGFLFIAGVSIPLALETRRQRGDSLSQLLGRILVRSASLLFMGVIMVNTGSLSVELTGMSRNLWYALAYLAIIVLWNAGTGKPETDKPWRRWVFRGVAALLLVFLLAIFRGKTQAGQAVWLRHSWWGILGLIGWAYLTCSLVYLVARGRPTALMGVLGFMIALYIGGRHGALNWLGPINDFVGVGSVLGSTAANMLAGVLVGQVFTGGSALHSAASRMKFMAAFGAGLYLAGTLLRPLHGIIKNQATESYTLVAAGLCCLLYLGFYWLIDVRNRRAWTGFLLPAGQNPLLAFLLPGLVMDLLALAGLTRVFWPYNSGRAGALNAAVMTALILLLNWGLTRAGVRLKL